MDAKIYSSRFILEKAFDGSTALTHRFLIASWLANEQIFLDNVPTNDDILMFNTLVTNKIPFIIIATKCDKLNQSGKAKLKKNFKVAFNVLEDLHVISTDNVKYHDVDSYQSLLNIMNTL